MGILSQSKRILITGASRGIGRSVAIKLARKGHRVVLASRDRAALEQVAREIAASGGSAEVLEMDITQDASVHSAIESLTHSEQCDVVINNAGSCHQQEFIVQDDATRRAEMELNYWGTLRVTRALLPHMMNRRAGVIVNVSSLLGVIASPSTANYSATKAALNAFSHALRGEVARFGLRVVVFVAPHTDTLAGRAVKFDRVVSLPVEYTADELIRSVDRTPRLYAASPVYRFLLRLFGLFPKFMEGKIAASAQSSLGYVP